MNRLLHTGIIAALVAGIRRRDPSLIVNGVLLLTFVSLPRYIERRYNVRFRPWQRGWISVAALIHTLGMLGPYDRVWWRDHLAHTLSGAIFAGIADVAYRFGVDGETHTSSRSRTVFVTFITFGLGLVWEVLEYVVHSLGDWVGFDPLLVHYGRFDAVGDLVFDLFGAMIVLLFGRERLSNLVNTDSEND